MDVKTLRAHLKAKGISQSELARRVGVSRQAVSLWLQNDGEVSVHARHLIGVSQALGVRAEELVQPLPCFDSDRHEWMRACYLWDRLYPDLDDFAIALNQRVPKAVARLVEVDGFYGAERILGKSVWKEFASYKRYIHPVRRHQLETLHTWHSNQTAA